MSLLNFAGLVLTTCNACTRPACECVLSSFPFWPALVRASFFVRGHGLVGRLGMARRRRGLPNQHHPKIIHVGARRPRDNQIVGGLKKAIGIVRRQRDVRVYTGRQGARQRIGEE